MCQTIKCTFNIYVYRLLGDNDLESYVVIISFYIFFFDLLCSKNKCARHICRMRDHYDVLLPLRRQLRKIAPNTLNIYLGKEIYTYH